MVSEEEVWRPGSFTKNFAWGETGLKQLHDCIRLGFDNRVEAVPRTLFARRVQHRYSFYIPANFFLFNRPQPEAELVPDELVFQAVRFDHSDRFDKLALFAFNFSYAGRFPGANASQRRPAMWAHWYVRDRLAHDLNWNVAAVSANDIEDYVFNDPRYVAQSARKLATNLSYLYGLGRLRDVATERVERWWVDAVFLAMDRLIQDRRLGRKGTKPAEYADVLAESGFADIAGRRSIEKDLATKHILKLYAECSGVDRFSEEAVRKRTEVRLKDVVEYIGPNSPDPLGAVHPTNPRILKSIPPACAMLARYGAGFDILPAMSLDDFDAKDFIKRKTREAIERLQSEGIEPTMTAEELLRLTRGR